jgi:hypothetical protein
LGHAIVKWLERFWYGCGNCRGGDSCPLVDAADQEAAQRLPWSHGWSLVFAASTVFLLPLTMAMVGAWLGGRYGDRLGLTTLGLRQGLGMLVGLSVGVGVAKLLIRLARTRSMPDSGDPE